MKGECPEWFDNWDPNLPLAQVSNICCQEKSNIVVSVLSLVTIYLQEILGWGAYLPLPGFDKKGRMVLFCQMEVLFLLIIMSNGGVVFIFLSL